MPQPYKDEEVLNRLYVQQGRSMMEISRIIDCSPSTVRKYLDEFGIERRSASEQIQMAYGGGKYTVPYQTDQRGYEVWWLDTTVDQKCLQVHRLIGIAKWGAEAVAQNDVHHKNGLSWDNRPENLEIMPFPEHMSKHQKRYTWLDKLGAIEMYRDGASSRDIGSGREMSGATALKYINEFDESLIRDREEANSVSKERGE